MYEYQSDAIAAYLLLGIMTLRAINALVILQDGKRTHRTLPSQGSELLSNSQRPNTMR